jgi:tetratricopeptide (TPR) repeat protein
MKVGSVFYALSVCAALVFGAAAQSSSPDDLYLEAYRLIQEGDALNQTGQAETARRRYSEAETNLKRIQTSHPNYNKNAVDFRLEYVQERLKTIPQKEQTARPETKPQVVNPNDPKALQQRIAQLEADNEMLQAKLRESLSARPAEVDPGQFAKSQERINQLEKEKELLRVRLEQAVAKQPQAAELAMLEQVRGELEATKKQLRDNVAAVAALTQENQRLQTLAQAPKAEAEPASKPQNESSRIKDLEKERDALLKKLNDANKEMYDVKSRGQAAQFEAVTNQLANLRARLEVFEARKSPYTKEELALMDQKIPKLAATVDAKSPKRSRELPAGAGLIIAEAERAFAARRYSEAEEKYKQVLKMDEQNPVSLANLAAIQIELQKLDEAEANIKKALAIDADDAYSLSLLGMLRFQQGNYQQALDALSRSAQIDAKNAETQNYLGITLSQLGQREPAEAALRKAILLNPNYAGAHHNLAVIYATQKPPFVELARLHYNKALALGQPANPELEKQLTPRAE